MRRPSGSLDWLYSASSGQSEKTWAQAQLRGVHLSGQQTTAELMDKTSSKRYWSQCSILGMPGVAILQISVPNGSAADCACSVLPIATNMLLVMRHRWCLPENELKLLITTFKAMLRHLESPIWGSNTQEFQAIYVNEHTNVLVCIINCRCTGSSNKIHLSQEYPLSHFWPFHCSP